MIRLVQTCGACPEQYDAYIGTECVGYLRLRHGRFRVEYKDNVLYSVNVPGSGGVFNDGDREAFLKDACEAIIVAHATSGKPLYTIETQDVKSN